VDFVLKESIYVDFQMSYMIILFAKENVIFENSKRFSKKVKNEE